jgi:cobalt-zinc-cadmium efflux system protein
LLAKNMLHNHQHDHRHARRDGARSLGWALALTAGFMAVEFAGGWLSGSLALISDAGHMLTDALALGLSLLAVRFAAAPADERKTYGFYRLEILAALLNGVTLIVLSGYIFYEAWQRLRSPAEIRSGIMIIVALAGLLVNLLGFFILRKSSKESLNVRGAFMHVVGDLLSSVAVVAGGLVIKFTGWYVIDPALSVLIGLVILKGAYDLVKESVDILLEAAPVGVESKQVAQALELLRGVKQVHHLHIWSISSGIHALSAHVRIDDQMTSQSDLLLADIQELLEHKFGILHTTIQFECAECADTTCSPVNCGAHHKE